MRCFGSLVSPKSCREAAMRGSTHVKIKEGRAMGQCSFLSVETQRMPHVEVINGRCSHQGRSGAKSLNGRYQTEERFKLEFSSIYSQGYAT